MAEIKSFHHLNIELLVQMLDPEKKGVVSLDRLLALSSKLKKDRSGQRHTMFKTGVELLKASVLLAVIVLVGIFAFMELEYDQYQERVNKNKLLKADIELALPVGSNISDILNLTSHYDEELDGLLRAMYENYTNVTLWDQLEDNGFVSTFALKNPWIFEDAAWFVFTIVTTIGYGHIAPISSGGRFLVIFYSIPAILSMAYFIKMLINYYKSCPCKKGSVRTQVLTLPVFFVVYFWISGCILHLCEGWRVGEGVYFTWVTVSTIGFGDYTISDENDAFNNMVILLVLINGLFMFSYAVTVIGNVVEYVTKPERWNEVFSRASLKKIELMSIPVIPSVKNAIKKSPKRASTNSKPKDTTDDADFDTMNL